MIELSKFVKNKNIFYITSLYCILIGVLYSLNNFNFKYFAVNTCIFILTLVLSVINNALFLIIVDMFIRQKISLKERIYQLIKSIFVSKLILFPAALCLLILNVFFKIDVIMLSKCITFLLIYISEFSLIISYKFIIKSAWSIAIEVVSLQFILTFISSLILKFI